MKQTGHEGRREYHTFPPTHVYVYCFHNLKKKKEEGEARYHYIALRWPESESRTAPNASKDVEQQKFTFLAGGNANGRAIPEDDWAISCKTKDILAMQSSNHAPWYLPKGSENIIENKTHTQMLITAVFIMNKIWK